MNGIKLYGKYISMTIRSQMEYKASFILRSVGHFIITFIEFVGIYALFLRFEQINGWTIREVAIFYGVINMSFAIAEAVGRGFDVFHIHVRKGTFDRILLRPRWIVFQIISTEFQLMRIGRFLQGAIVLIWGIVGLEHGLAFYDCILILYSIICSAMFFIGLMIIQATLSFWSVESLEIMNSFTYGGVQTAQYPLDIYKKWFQKIFVFVIPIGSVNYFPMYAIIKQEGYLLGTLTPLIGIAFLGLSYIGFTIGTRYYCSTGS